jgi:tRNA A-37 threonylcarbamoyl transferase component Bud32
MTATIHCAGCQHAYIETALFCPNCGRAKVREGVVDPLLGKLLGERFLVQEALGQGGSGTIYRAEHVTLRRKVAIKVLHTELSRDDLAIERFRREATTVAEIDNEHIVEIHDFGRTPDGRLYLAMELLEGATLDAVLARDQQLSVERAADILIQVGEALMEAHAIGYVHRDLRPRNIYLSVRRGKANFVKLLDFGLAKLVETEGQAASTSLGMTFGDPRYMSPEQARGDRIDRRADIYQLGCVAYEMLTGAPPFGGHRVFDILTKQVTEAPQPLPTRRPGVPLWMEAAVTKMLAKDPENRFATTTRMVEALRRGLETGEVMEDDVARRRESVPPPSVSRVMQRMGMQAGSEPPRPAPVPEALPAAAPVAPPVVAAPVAPPVVAAPVASPVVAAPVAAPVAPAGGPRAAPPGTLDPRVTMQAPVAPPPGKPDSVELLRKRTGTPRLGVPIYDPAPAAQAPVAGVINPSPREAASLTSPAARARASSPLPTAEVIAEASGQGSVHVSAPVSGQAPPAQPAAASRELDAARLRSAAEPGHGEAGGERPGGPASDPNISQAWYDEGDELSGDDGAPGARVQRARKTISPSITDLSFDGDDERPRRRWGLLVGASAFAIIGATVAFALTRGGAPTGKATALASHDPPSATAPAEVAPSQIISTDPPATDVTAAPTGSAAPAPPRDAAGAASKPPAGAHHAVEPHAPVELHAPAGGRRPVETGFPVLGSEPTRRLPGLGSGATPPVTPTVTPVVTPSDPGKGPKVPSLTDSPKDPYGGDDTPSDGAAPEKKAEFFANLGSQQLIGGDTTGAASNFKKALELDGKNVAATAGMGEIALRQGLFGDAIAHLSRAARLSPRNAKVLTLLGEAYLNSGNNAQAATNFKKALQLDPDNGRARDGYNEASSRVPPASDD